MRTGYMRFDAVPGLLPVGQHVFAHIDLNGRLYAVRITLLERCSGGKAIVQYESLSPGVRFGLPVVLYTADGRLGSLEPMGLG